MELAWRYKVKLGSSLELSETGVNPGFDCRTFVEVRRQKGNTNRSPRAECHKNPDPQLTNQPVSVMPHACALGRLVDGFNVLKRQGEAHGRGLFAVPVFAVPYKFSHAGVVLP
jgi:hypothetical protein